MIHAPVGETSAAGQRFEKASEPPLPKRPLRSLVQFCALLALLWCLFFALYAAFPYVRSGAETIYMAKAGLLSRGIDADLVIFGNSKALAGFRPASFDAATGIRSYNLGLPDEDRFISNLEKLAANRAPRLVLLTMTQSATERKANLFHYLDNDRATADRLFPFRHFPRDLTLFLLRSRTQGGPASFYRQSEGLVARMEADRGYYFIEAQSQGRLPPDFHLPGDRPDFVNARTILNPGDLARLQSLAERYDMQIWFVPSYYRPDEYASPPAENAGLAAMIRTNPRFHLAGPDYWIFPLAYFSDPAHLNPEGAEVYTRRLAELLSPAIHR